MEYKWKHKIGDWKFNCWMCNKEILGSQDFKKQYRGGYVCNECYLFDPDCLPKQPPPPPAEIPAYVNLPSEHPSIAPSLRWKSSGNYAWGKSFKKKWGDGT